MKNFSTSIQRRKRGMRTEYIARLTYYDKTGKRKGVSKNAATHCDAKRELQDLIDQHEAGGRVLESRRGTSSAQLEPRHQRNGSIFAYKIDHSFSPHENKIIKSSSRDSIPLLFKSGRPG